MLTQPSGRSMRSRRLRATESAVSYVTHTAEYQWLTVGSNNSDLATADLHALIASWEALTGRSIQTFVEFGPEAVRTKNWVGLIRLPDVTLVAGVRGSLSLSSGHR